MFPFSILPNHHGVVLDISQNGFSQSATAMGSIFFDDYSPKKTYLFYTGAPHVDWHSSKIGLATSANGVDFQKISGGPIVEGAVGTFCHAQALNPVVARMKNRFFMILSGKPSPDSPRRIGIAYADDPEGPWQVVGELLKPSSFWEGNGIDNGCSVAKLDEETLIVYYSSLTSIRAYDLFTFLRRYPVRRIGVLKVRVRGATLSSIEAIRYHGNPLRHLNGPKRNWNESVFCPGYIKLGEMHYLFPTGSTYSVGYPYRQYIGVTTGKTPYFDQKDAQSIKIIDGPKEKAQILPSGKSEIALDTPCPYFNDEKRKLYLYYSVADRADEKWKIALTTYDFKE